MSALEAVLAPGAILRALEPGLYSVLDPGDEGAHYDSRAAAYDRLVASRGYSRLAWGAPNARHAAFVARALTAREEGFALDVAAGSCLASAAVYPRTSRPVIVLDRSLAMLHRGMARLREVAGRLPPHVVFLQADATALPLRAGSVATVLCHGAFHVFDAPARLEVLGNFAYLTLRAPGA